MCRNKRIENFLTNFLAWSIYLSNRPVLLLSSIRGMCAHAWDADIGEDALNKKNHNLADSHIKGFLSTATDNLEGAVAVESLLPGPQC